MLSIADRWRRRQLRRRNPGWTVLRLRYVGGWRAYRMRPDHDVHAGTLQALAGHMARCEAPGKPGVAP